MDMYAQIVRDALVAVADKHFQGQPVRSVLRDGLGLPDAFVQQRLQQGLVHIGSVLATPDTAVLAGQKIWLTGGVEEESGVDEADVQRVATYAPPIDVLHEDDHLLVINKPAGLLVYPGSAADTDTLAHRVAAYYAAQGVRRRVWHVHRLDRDTTGAILYAKHAYSARALDGMLADRRIHRDYLALVTGTPSPRAGIIDLSIGRDRHVAGRYRVSTTGKSAITQYRTLASEQLANGAISLVGCTLTTGRTHQIRVHFAARGHAVIGDTLYGGGEGVGNLRFAQGQALHAHQIQLVHPYDLGDVRVTAPLTGGLADVVSQFGWQALVAAGD